MMTALSRHGSALGAQFDLDRHSVRREYHYMALFIQAFQERLLDMLDTWLDTGVVLFLGQRGCMHDGASHKVTANEQKRKQMFGLGDAPRLLALNAGSGSGGQLVEFNGTQLEQLPLKNSRGRQAAITIELIVQRVYFQWLEAGKPRPSFF